MNLKRLLNFSELSHLSDLPEIELVRMRMTVRVSLIGALFGLSFAIVLFLFNIYIPALVCLLQPVLYILVVYLIHKNKFSIAKILQTFTACWGIFAFASYCGEASGVHLYILLGPTFVLSLYDLGDKKSIILSLLAWISTFFLFTFFNINPIFPKITDTLITPQIALVLYTINILFIIILSTLLMSFVLNLNSDFMLEILRKNKILSSKENDLKEEIEQGKISEGKLKLLFAELQISYERVNHFSQMVSHNMRSPIANLKGIMNVINDLEINEEEKKEYLNAIGVSVNKLDRVIADMNEILYVQKDINEKRRIVNFESQLLSVIGIEKHTIDRTKAQITYDFNTVKNILSLNSFIHSILHNLLSNSIKYRKPVVPPTIHVRSYIKNEHVFLIVTDNGLGIDLDRNLGNIFKPYTRFHTHVEGKGLGLYLVQSQVQMLGGKVTIESKVGVGTSFIIDFGTVETLIIGDDVEVSSEYEN